jgi:hypothetical protein
MCYQTDVANILHRLRSVLFWCLNTVPSEIGNFAWGTSQLDVPKIEQTFVTFVVSPSQYLP